MSNSSIWSINRTLSGATTLGQSGPMSNGNEEVLHITQSSNITGASPSDKFNVISRTIAVDVFYSLSQLICFGLNLICLKFVKNIIFMQIYYFLDSMIFFYFYHSFKKYSVVNMEASQLEIYKMFLKFLFDLKCIGCFRKTCIIP